MIGLGKIGSLVAGDGAALGMRVLATDPSRATGLAAVGAERAELPDLLAASRRRHVARLARARRAAAARPRGVALFKPGSILVNAARAELIDIEELIHGLALGRPAWAFMDVGSRAAAARRPSP